jgi:hypothetical protein
MTVRSQVAIALVMILFSGTAGAHHNMSALFDFNNRVTITGTLTKFDWANGNLDARRSTAHLLQRARYQQERLRKCVRQNGYGRSQPRSGRLARRALANHDTAGREARLGLSAKLLRRPNETFL